MSAFNRRIVDGGVQYESRLLTINVGKSNATTTPIDYATDNFNWNVTSEWSDRTNELGVADGSVGVIKPATGTASLQLPDASTEIPFVFNTFSEDFFGETVTCIITDVGRKESKNGITMVDISFRKALSTSLVSLDSAGTSTTISGVSTGE